MSDLDLHYQDVDRLSIDNHGAGAIDIVSSGDDTVTGRISCPDEDYLQQVTVRQTRDTLRIDFPKMSWFRGQTVDLELAVPDDLALELTTGSGDVDIAVPIRQSRITSGSGDVDLDDVAGLRCTTGSGDVSIKGITDGPSTIGSGSGNLVVSDVSAALQAKSASGDVEINRLSEALRANTASGDITVNAARGSAEIRTASGSVRIGVADSLSAWLDLNSRSGSVDIELDNTEPPATADPYVAIRAVTASGNIAIVRA
jgi:DUF4097 and DUF4098 domain-containing protein YvlB